MKAVALHQSAPKGLSIQWILHKLKRKINKMIPGGVLHKVRRISFSLLFHVYVTNSFFSVDLNERFISHDYHTVQAATFLELLCK